MRPCTPILRLSLLQSLLISVNAAQPDSAYPQLNTFNSTPGSAWSAQAQDVIRDSGIDNQASQAVQTAVEFERSNWAGYSVQTDPFYSLPQNASPAAASPGQVLKVEQYTNTSLYTVPPDVSMSRFLYQTETFNGSVVSTSAYILWPWMPRIVKNNDSIPVVAWAHGTSGTTSECAPSHIRNLWYQYSAPYVLALQGYAVIGVDYAGLGPNRTASGEPIVHQYECNPAGANDLFYAVEAAQTAWPSELSKEFVVFGHSEGGGYAWAAAQRQAVKPVPGYLGAIAASPVTGFQPFLAHPPATLPSLLARWSQTMSSLFPSFDIRSWLTPSGIQARQLYIDLNGCYPVQTELFAASGFVQPNWYETWYLSVFDSLCRSGNKPIAGPLLVLQGLSDTTIFPNMTIPAFEQTCQISSGNQSLHLATFEGVTHVPALYAGQRVWLNWIADRFDGVSMASGCTTAHYQPPRPVSSYEKDINFFLEYAVYTYDKVA